ncbi:MAG: NAD-dependent epimerase/dehydratase family protein [Candidatus Omnitrophica bacterium]|nr:NAD-dependent epimerase/dehydratase family protein [Candidatus Omnitrophota bacterium]
MDKASTLLIVGHHGPVEQGLYDHFSAQGYRVISSVRTGLDVLDRRAVEAFFDMQKPAQVILASVRSGGISANQNFPAEFMYDNLVAQNNIVDAAYRRGVAKLLFLAASCVYPKECPQPMKEEYFLMGAMEPTSAPYSTAKAAGVVLCQAYRKQYGFNAIVGIPATVYGDSDGEAPENQHVLGAMLAKFEDALKMGAPDVTFWGTGTPCREFISAKDLAGACEFLLKDYNDAPAVNIGAGTDVSIAALAGIIKDVTGFQGDIRWDTKKPDGAMKKLLDSSKLLKMGWRPCVSLKDGIAALWAKRK